MNFKLTMTLVIILALVCVAYFYIPEKKPTVKIEQTSTPILNPKPKGIKTIEFTSDGEEQVAFWHQDKDWEMTYPVHGKAESWQGDTISDSLTGLAYKDKFQAQPTGTHSAQVTGTDKPNDIIKFTDDAGKSYTLGLGKRTVGGIYATLDGGKTVYLLADNPLDALDKPAESFRDKSITSVATDNVEDLKIARAGHAIDLHKTGEKWLITTPVNARANEARVTDILGTLKSIQATGFSKLPKNSAGTGLNPPVLAVTAMVQETLPPEAQTKPAKPPATTPASSTVLKPVTLQIGYYTSLADKKNVYASLAGSDEVFTLHAASFDKLNQQLSDLRDPAITPAMVGQATSATITTDGKVAVSVQKKDGKWMLTSTPTPLAAGDLEVGNWLGDVSNLRAIKFVDDAGDLKSIGLDPPHTRMEFTVPGQSQREVILVGKPETADKVTPMMRQGEPTVYLVQTGDAEKVMMTPLALRDKTIERLPATGIRAIAITGPDAPQGGTTLERQGTTWKVTAAKKTDQVDDQKITDLLAEFTPLTAEKYLSEQPETGPADVTVTLSVFESATVPTPATAPGKTSASTLPAALHNNPVGPEQGKTVQRILKLFKPKQANNTQWHAAWDGTPPQWTFEPTPKLVTELTKETYATAPTTQPVPATK